MEDVVLPLRGSAQPLPGVLADAILKSLDCWMARLRATAAKADLPDLAPSLALLAAVKPAAPANAAAKAAEASAKPAEPAAKPSEVAVDLPPAPAANDDTQTDSWRVSTRQVIALLHEVERLREVRLRLDERRRDLEKAVLHGLEMPEVREARGKHREGALTIRVEQQGNMLFIEVADDGAGLDLEQIREAALRRTLVPAEELANMSTQQLHQLVFRPGFSTRTEATEYSGRGVGLDVVRNQIQALQGHVELQSVAGQGARFVLTLPADLGSSPVLVVRCGEHQLGIPMAAVESSRAARGGDLRVGRSRVQLDHREQLIPVQDPGALVGLRQPEVPADGQPLLILQSQGRRLALSVDEVLGDRELVIRPLPLEVRDLAAWQGAATLARGELVLILRPDFLVSSDRRAESGLAGLRRALVVDDSPPA